MARAKQTNRADARRRYRQALAQSDAEAESAGDEEAPQSGSPGGGSARPAARGSQARPSIGAAFREAYRPAHIREDLAALPGLLILATPARIPLTRTVLNVPWFLVSALLVIAGFVAYLVSPTEGAFIFQLLALPPGGPTLPILLVGFMATRASYLQGLLIGLLDLALVGLYAAFVPAAATTNATLADIVGTAAVTGLPTSVLFAGAAAWYRRFLTLTSPRRPQQSGGRNGGRATKRR